MHAPVYFLPYPSLDCVSLSFKSEQARVKPVATSTLKARKPSAAHLGFVMYRSTDSWASILHILVVNVTACLFLMHVSGFALPVEGFIAKTPGAVMIGGDVTMNGNGVVLLVNRTGAAVEVTSQIHSVQNQLSSQAASTLSAILTATSAQTVSLQYAQTTMLTHLQAYNASVQDALQSLSSFIHAVLDGTVSKLEADMILHATNLTDLQAQAAVEIAERNEILAQLTTLLQDETAQRIGQVFQFNLSLIAEGQQRDVDIVPVKAALAQEVPRATAAEAAISVSLQSEITRSAQAEQDLMTAIQAEQNATVQALYDQAILRNASIFQEQAREIARQRLLNESIIAEVSRAIAAERSVNLTLQAEIQARLTALSSLTNQMNTEISRAENAEDALSGNVDAINLNLNSLAATQTSFASLVASITVGIASLQAEFDTTQIVLNNFQLQLGVNDASLTNLNAQVLVEVARATVGESAVAASDVLQFFALSSLVTVESTRAQGNESIIAGQISSEQTRALAAESAAQLALQPVKTAQCGGGPCTATATCPTGMHVVQGWGYSQNPDNYGGAYGQDVCRKQTEQLRLQLME